jgi:hypothetical protein
MGLYQMGPPAALTLALQQRLGIQDFIETGTFHGHTAAWAAGHFGRVTTVELSPAYHAAAQARFCAQSNVHTLAGDSVVALRAVVPNLITPAIFWLDAHWSGLDTAGHEAECPVLAEIALINASSLAHVILVDDARLFCAPPPRPHRAEQWPGLAAMVAALAQEGRRHVIQFEDAFVAVPAGEREWLAGVLQDAPAATAPPRHGLMQRIWRRLAS